MTFQLSPYFNLVYFYPKSHGLTWDWGVPSLGVLRTHFQVFSWIPCGNPKILASYYGYWIGSLMGERGKGAKLISNVLIQYLSDLWDTLGLHVPILTLNFHPSSLICAIVILRVREELVCESTNTLFSTKKDLTPILRKKILLDQNFIWITRTHFYNFKFYIFSSLLISSQAIPHQTSKLPFMDSPQDRSTHLGFHFTCHSNSWIWLDFGSEHHFCDLACTTQLLHSSIKLENFLVKISVFHMKFIKWPAWQVCLF